MAECIRNSAIALFDSGIGGLTIMKEVVSLLPNEDIIYYADSAHCPYGEKSAEEIITLSKNIVEFLLTKGVKLIVVACNSATTNSISTLRSSYPEMLFVGTEPAVKPALEATESGIVGIIATQSTISSKQVERLYDRYGADEVVYEVSGVGLVEMIERSEENGEECKTLLKGYIEPLIEKGIDCLALGCTHYPFLLSAIGDIVGDRGVKIINPAPAIARRVKSLLEERGLMNDRGVAGEHLFCSSMTEESYTEMLKVRYDEYKCTGAD